MILILFIGLIFILVFLYCACNVSSKCSRIEEQEKRGSVHENTLRK